MGLGQTFIWSLFSTEEKSGLSIGTKLISSTENPERFLVKKTPQCTENRMRWRDG